MLFLGDLHDREVDGKIVSAVYYNRPEGYVVLGERFAPQGYALVKGEEPAEETYRLLDDLYVFVPFGEYKAAEAVSNGGNFWDGFLSAKVMDDHLPTERERWLSGKLNGLGERRITPTKIVTIGDQVFKGATSGFNYRELISGLFGPETIKAGEFETGVYGQVGRTAFEATQVFCGLLGSEPFGN